MTSSREVILGRLRGRATPVPAAEAPDFSVLERRQWPVGERLALFQQMIESVQGEVLVVPRNDWIGPLCNWLQQGSISNLLVGPTSELGQTLLADWPDNGIDLLPYEHPIETWKDTLFNNVGAAITSTQGAIAETGSLIVRPDKHEPRLMSLVPPVHIAVLDATHIYSTLLDAMRDQRWAAGMPTNQLLISGPSKTADIEQTLAYGVHGPGRLLVLIQQ